MLRLPRIDILCITFKPGPSNGPAFYGAVAEMA